MNVFFMLTVLNIFFHIYDIKHNNSFSSLCKITSNCLKIHKYPRELQGKNNVTDFLVELFLINIFSFYGLSYFNQSF